MHPCLSVDEILRLLAYKLVESEAKATAVSLACCCKSFEDPALDALWETQDELLPLLRSFPGGAWKTEAGQFVRVLTHFTLSSSDCFTEEGFRETPNERGMESFPKICSGNTSALSGPRRGLDNFRCSVCTAIPHRWRTFASKTGDLQVHPHNQGLRSVHPSLPFLDNYRYPHLIHPRLPHTTRRFDNHKVSDTLSPHQVPSPRIPSKRFGHNRGYL